MVMQDRTSERMKIIKKIVILIQEGKRDYTIRVCVLLENQGGEAWKMFMDSLVGGFLKMVGPQEPVMERIQINDVFFTPYTVPYSLWKYLENDFKERCESYGIPVEFDLRRI